MLQSGMYSEVFLATTGLNFLEVSVKILLMRVLTPKFDKPSNFSGRLHFLGLYSFFSLSSFFSSSSFLRSSSNNCQLLFIEKYAPGPEILSKMSQKSGRQTKPAKFWMF